MVMGNSKNSRIFNFAILLKLRKSQKFDAHEIYVFYNSYFKYLAKSTTKCVPLVSVCMQT